MTHFAFEYLLKDLALRDAITCSVPEIIHKGCVIYLLELLGKGGYEIELRSRAPNQVRFDKERA
jgi:hypothetical protein